MTLGILGPCGMNTPHLHPRATEMLFLINGTITTGMIAENGARFVYNTVDAGTASVYLQGSMHWQQNEGCEPAMFICERILSKKRFGVTSSLSQPLSATRTPVLPRSASGTSVSLPMSSLPPSAILECRKLRGSPARCAPRSPARGSRPR